MLEFVIAHCLIFSLQRPNKMMTAILKLLLFLGLTVPSLGAFRSLRGAVPNNRISSSHLAFSNDAFEWQGRGLQKFDWNISLVEGYPDLAGVLDDGDTNQIDFLYEFAGNVTGPDRSIKVSLFEKDCLTPGSLEPNAALTFTESIVDNDLEVQLELSTEAIQLSQYYTRSDLTTGKFCDSTDLRLVFISSYLTTNFSFLTCYAAQIGFCLRVDYEYLEDSINFHEGKISETYL